MIFQPEKSALPQKVSAQSGTESLDPKGSIIIRNKGNIVVWISESVTHNISIYEYYISLIAAQNVKE